MENLFQNIEFLGMLCLGSFVGGIINYGLLKIGDSDSFLKVSISILGSAFSGVVFVFLQFFINQGMSKQTIFMYPIGLILSLLWLQIIPTLDKKIPSRNWKIQVIGFLHITFLICITFLLIGRILFGGKIT